MDDPNSCIMPVMGSLPPRYASYLPDELLLAILSYVLRDAKHQSTLASFCRVNRQWYDIGIAGLYKAPFLFGHAYTLFVRTICPSVIPRIKRSELAGLVKELDLSRIVHQGTKSTTARLLGRTKTSLELFVAPQASFAINCWASLSKCTKLKTLDLSLISEAISYQSLNQTLRQLNELTHLYMPRCRRNYEEGPRKLLVWPPRLEHLSLSGSLNGMSWRDNTFPPTLHSMSVLHCPGFGRWDIPMLLSNIGDNLTTIELRDLPAIMQGQLNDIFNWLPKLTHMTVAIYYIDEYFGLMPRDFEPAHWEQSKPLQSLTLVTSPMPSNYNPERGFEIVDLFHLIDQRFLGRLRMLGIASSTRWEFEHDVELEALISLLVDELDKENFENSRWHYSGVDKRGLSYAEWVKTPMGRQMRARLLILNE